MEYLKKFDSILIDKLHTGSRVICNPPPKYTDDDWIIYLGEGSVGYVRKELEKGGFKLGGSLDKHYEEGDFYSYKKDDLNIIVTTNPDFLSNSKKATDLCRALNLLKKEDRITVFRAIRDDYWPVFKEYVPENWAWQNQLVNGEVRPVRMRIPIDWGQVNEPHVLGQQAWDNAVQRGMQVLNG